MCVLYIYMHIYTYVYIYTHIFMCIHTHKYTHTVYFLNKVTLKTWCIEWKHMWESAKKLIKGNFNDFSKVFILFLVSFADVVKLSTLILHSWSFACFISDPFSVSPLVIPCFSGIDYCKLNFFKFVCQLASDQIQSMKASV